MTPDQLIQESERNRSEFTQITGRYIQSHNSLDSSREDDPRFSDKRVLPNQAQAMEHDITERKETEQALRTSNERLSLALAASNMGVWEWNVQTNAIFWSPECFEILGAESFNGSLESFTNVLHPDDADRVMAVANQAMAEKTSYSVEYRIIRSDGRMRWISALARTTYDEKGSPLLQLGTLQDITERKIAEESLKEKTSQLQAILDYSPALISIKDLKGNVILATRNFAVLDAPPLHEFIGKNVFDLFPREVAQTLWNNDLAALRANGPVESEEVVKHMDGSWHTYFTVKFPVHKEPGQPFGICAISTDITERKRAEESLRQEKEAAEVHRLAMEAAETTARTKSQFFANMSHELRTPMTGILGLLQLALEENPAPALREYLETAYSSSRSLLQILNDILDMSKIEAGKLTIEEKPFSLQKCIAEAVNSIIPEARRKGLDFVLSVAEEIPAAVDGDQARLRQVLLNLIVNALKFTERGTVEVRVTAGRTPFSGKREFTFAVSDTGIGIPDDKKNLIFQTFSQVDASHSRSYGGTGLGLAICREIVALMEGKISFMSEVGVGSTFSFAVPLRETRLESVVPSADKHHFPETVTASEGEKIPRLLFAEDDPATRQVLGSFLKLTTNYQFDFAEDGLKAVEMWENGEYDLVLMDAQMPRLDGFEATHAIRNKERERGGHTPIVAMTAHARKEDEARCLAAGMDAFISKPIDFNECLQVIGKIIRQKSGGDN